MAETWGNKQPRPWQKEALPIAIGAFESEMKALVRAATGSGKSILQAEIISRTLPKVTAGKCLLVTAPTQKLVCQLAITINDRIPGSVGRFYQNEKRIDRPVIVACHASIEELEVSLRSAGIDPYGWIADECHKTESEKILGFAESMQVKKILGFTATPFRRKENERLTLFDELAYDYGPQRAIQDGVIVPPRIQGYDGTSEDIDEVCAEWIHSVKGTGPGIVNAWHCDDADQYAEFMNERGLKTASIHSKLKEKDQQRLIKALGSGSLDCLVHVNMLTEGVDLPWLKWLCMRRASESKRAKGNLRIISRVRFIQEIGRILRSYPGKTEALIFDPNDLFGTLALDYDAILGESEEEDTDDPTELVALEVMRSVNLGGPIEDQRIQVIEQRSFIQQYVRQVALTLRLLGFSALKSSGTKWRHYPPTNRQNEMMTKLLPRVQPYVEAMPGQHRSSLRAACLASRQGQLNQGDMFDLNTILSSMDRHGGWPLPS